MNPYLELNLIDCIKETCFENVKALSIIPKVQEMHSEIIILSNRVSLVIIVYPDINVLYRHI